MDTTTAQKVQELHWDQVLHVPWSPSDMSSNGDFAQTPGSTIESPISDKEEQEDILASRPGTTTATAFQPGASIYHLPSDTVLVSLDLVCFHVHSELLLIVSQNQFNTLLSPMVSSPLEYSPIQKRRETYIDVPEQSSILNIILHVAYGMSVTPYAPTFDMLSESLDRLPTYGIDPRVALTSSSAFHSTLMIHAPTNPLKLYTLASRHDCFDLAASTSPFLLSQRVENMSDTAAGKIGPVYLSRLFSLQWKRMGILRQLLSMHPPSHIPMPTCDIDAQKSVTKAWTLASAYLLWEGRPDMSPRQVDSVLRTLSTHAPCQHCKRGLNERIDFVVQSWTEVKQTI